MNLSLTGCVVVRHGNHDTTLENGMFTAQAASRTECGNAKCWRYNGTTMSPAVMPWCTVTCIYVVIKRTFKCAAHHAQHHTKVGHAEVVLVLQVHK